MARGTYVINALFIAPPGSYLNSQRASTFDPRGAWTWHRKPAGMAIDKSGDAPAAQDPAGTGAPGGTQMTDEPKGERRPPEQERELETVLQQPPGEQERKPEQTKRDEWRGTGVCGDRHTD